MKQIFSYKLIIHNYTDIAILNSKLLHIQADDSILIENGIPIGTPLFVILSFTANHNKVWANTYQRFFMFSRVYNIKKSASAVIVLPF